MHLLSVNQGALLQLPGDGKLIEAKSLATQSRPCRALNTLYWPTYFVGAARAAAHAHLQRQHMEGGERSRERLRTQVATETGHSPRSDVIEFWTYCEEKE